MKFRKTQIKHQMMNDFVLKQYYFLTLVPQEVKKMIYIFKTRQKNTHRHGESHRVDAEWSLTHLVGQGHKRRCLPGLQWSMKPPGECNRRALAPPYRPLAKRPASGCRGRRRTKPAGCSDLPCCQVPGCQQRRLMRTPHPPNHHLILVILHH